MSIKLEKELIIREINNCDEEWVLKAIRRILYNHDEIDLEVYNKDLEEAEQEIEHGKFITQEELKNKVKTWE